MSDKYSPYSCPHCGVDMNDDHVPVRRLEELIAEWRGMGEKAGVEEFTIAYTRAANELEELIEEYDDG